METKTNTFGPSPAETWKRRAMAFAIRSHKHLWGKNNEDPQVFLYRQGLNNEFSHTLYLGWNKFGQERPYKNWGMEGEGKFFIPPGLVYPYIVEKELKSLFILSIEAPGRYFQVPGGAKGPLVLGSGKKERKTHDILEGLALFQENPDTLIRIFPELVPAAPSHGF